MFQSLLAPPWIKKQGVPPFKAGHDLITRAAMLDEPVKSAFSEVFFSLVIETNQFQRGGSGLDRFYVIQIILLKFCLCQGLHSDLLPAGLAGYIYDCTRIHRGLGFASGKKRRLPGSEMHIL